MPELFVYDASEVNRKKRTYHRYDDDPTVVGFRQALRELNPPTPFLVRGLWGDYEYGRDEFNHPNGKMVIKNTFQGKTLISYLERVLKNGHNKDNPRGTRSKHPNEKALVSSKEIKFCDIIWASEHHKISESIPYRSYEGESPDGLINDFTMIINPIFYLCDDASRLLFYQPDISLRRKALLGILISDTNPNRKRLKPMRFTLTPESLENVVREIQQAGYFTHPK